MTQSRSYWDDGILIVIMALAVVAVLLSIGGCTPPTPRDLGVTTRPSTGELTRDTQGEIDDARKAGKAIVDAFDRITKIVADYVAKAPQEPMAHDAMIQIVDAVAAGKGGIAAAGVELDEATTKAKAAEAQSARDQEMIKTLHDTIDARDVKIKQLESTDAVVAFFRWLAYGCIAGGLLGFVGSMLATIPQFGILSILLPIRGIFALAFVGGVLLLTFVVYLQWFLLGGIITIVGGLVALIVIHWRDIQKALYTPVPIIAPPAQMANTGGTK